MLTLRVAKRPTGSKPRTDTQGLSSPTPSLVLEARNLASGTFDQIGLPQGGVEAGASTGPGSGGGVGSGSGTGIGPGRGPGFGPGAGGSVGGGVYRPGGAVTAPRLLAKVQPRYTQDALSWHPGLGLAGSRGDRRGPPD